MPGIPDGPMQFEEDLEQIRDDISRIREDIDWMSQFGPALMNIMNELRTIRRLMEVHMGEITQEELLEEVEENKKELRAFESAHEQRLRMRRE